MGAKVDIKLNSVIIKGIRRFHFNQVTSTDLRGGMAALLCALKAEGISEIYSADRILRGYEDLEQKISAVGAEIKIEGY